MLYRLFACILVFYTFPALAAKHAFVLGNAAYENLPVLKNTLADAAAYRQAFTQLGYEVDYHEDLRRESMEDKFEIFLNRVAPGDQVTFVYSGHGWSDGVVNYLIPIDSPSNGSDSKLKRISVALRNGYNGILDQLEAAGVSLTVAVIDACRNNPFKPLEGKKSLSMSRGLARVQAATGTFVIFSAGIGQEALDGLPEDPADQKLSVFTRSFVPLLTSGLYLEDAISEAQVETARLAKLYFGHKQHPAYYDETLGKTCLAEVCNTAFSVKPIKTSLLCRANSRCQITKICEINGKAEVCGIWIESGFDELPVFWVTTNTKHYKLTMKDDWHGWVLGGNNSIINYVQFDFDDKNGKNAGQIKIDDGTNIYFKVEQKFAVTKKIFASKNLAISIPESRPTSGTIDDSPVPTPARAHFEPDTEDISTSQVAYLYEDSTENAVASRTKTSIVWTLAQEAPSVGAPVEAVVKGRLVIPEKSISMTVLLKRNTNSDLPASHIIELNFDGDDIDNMPRFIMKATEQAIGSGLIAVTAKLANGQFLIALNDLSMAVKKNTELLLNSDWIDIPLLRANGHRILLTLKKGAIGDKIFRAAFEDWKTQKH